MIKLLDKFKTFFSKKPIAALCVCYGIVVAFIIVAHLAPGAFDEILYLTGGLKEKSLSLNDFTHVDVEQISDMEMINASGDTQLHFSDNEQIRNLHIKCTFSSDPGEFVLFYANNAQQGFGTNKQLYAKIVGDEYVFTLPRGAKAIRIDTGVEPSVTVNFDYITLNKHSFNNSMRFSTATIFNMLILPALLYAILNVLLAFYELILKFYLNKKAK